MPDPEVILLPVEDEWPHPPTSDWDWQESVVLAFQDPAQRLGGFIRIGHHPNRGTGNCTFGIVSPDGGYNRSGQDIAMRAGDRFEHGFAIDGFLSADFDAGSSRWRASDRDCDIDLEVANLHPLYDTWALSGLAGAFRDKFAASHTEVAGRVKGSVRIGDSRWMLDGFGYRDHSWGVRHMDDPDSALANFFWLVGSFGEDFVFAVADVITAAGKRTNMGFVIKDGEFDLPEATDISFITELDGISMRGARCRFQTRRHGEFDFEIEGFGNVLLGMEQRYLECGMPGRVRWGDRVGGAHLSTLFNARGGLARPPILFGASQRNGLYRRMRFRDAAHLAG